MTRPACIIDVERLTPTAANAGRLRGLRLRALADAPDAFATTLAETAARPPGSWIEALEQLATFVVAIDGRDVGMVRGAAYEGRPGAAILLSMWVAPEARGRGVGDALVAAQIDWARAEGFAALALDVADDNQPAIALYARHGFEPTGARSTLPPPREHIREHERLLAL